ncbi:MAG: amidase [Hyphomicrobiales bacterium]
MTKTISPIVIAIDPPIWNRQEEGLLSGKTCAVKDNIDIEAMQTGGGNPAWETSHAAAQCHSAALLPLLDAGATLTSKTHLDELAFSLMGTNHHYGTPHNPKAVNRVPGGSSSGSASAVASGLADIGIGTDTGGSVRLPASFCGLYGLRPSHGVISMNGVIPLAPSYDTIGFFTRTLADIEGVASIYFPPAPEEIDLNLVAPRDVWEMADSEVRDGLNAVHRLDQLKHDDRNLFNPRDETDWSEVFRIHQSYEVWRELGPWIEENNPGFGPGLDDRFAFAASVAFEDFEKARQERRHFTQFLDSELAPSEILAIPTSPAPAPYLSSSQEEFNAFRKKAISMLCIAGHAGWPQLSIPGAIVNDAPVGLSLVGRPGSEMTLIKYAEELEASCDGYGN